MRKAKTLADLNIEFQKRVQSLTEEYDHQKLQSQTFADYMVALGIAYAEERSRINGGMAE